MEERNEFRKIKDIAEYVKQGLYSGELTVNEAEKVARVEARQGKVGEVVVTKLADGLEETKNTVKEDEETGEPGWVVTNPNGEKYIVEDSVFKKRYEADSEGHSKYKPRGKVLVTKINEAIEFRAPWGENMKIGAGGFIVLGGPKDIYGIQEKEFNNTYVRTKRDEEECLEEALNMLGI